MDLGIEKPPLHLPPGYSCTECRTDVDFVSGCDDPCDSRMKDANARTSVHMAGCVGCWNYFAEKKKIPRITKTA